MPCPGLSQPVRHPAPTGALLLTLHLPAFMWCNSMVDREPGESTRRAWREGPEHPFLLDNVWDIVLLLDYLDARPDVDSRQDRHDRPQPAAACTPGSLQP